MNLEEYNASRQNKADALDHSFIQFMIRDRGESWVARAIELASDIEDQEAFLILPEHKTDDRVQYVESLLEDVGTVLGVKLIDNELYYLVKWDDGEPTDLYTAAQIVKVKS